jgi:hypothetical protein
MVAIELNDCHEPRLSTEAVDLTPLPEHGDRLQRFARREILTARTTCFAPTPNSYPVIVEQLTEFQSCPIRASGCIANAMKLKSCVL